MSKLILHIGAHKTGTTSVQHCFHANRWILAWHGVAYPHVFKNKAHHVLATPWMHDILKRTRVTPAAAHEMWRRIVARYAHTDKTVFLSAENFSRVLPNHVDFAEIAEIVSPFDEVEVIYLMREQISMFQSIYLQVTKDNPNPPAYVNLLNHAQKDLAPTGVTLDHGRILKMVETGFSRDQITFADYHVVKRGPDGIMGYMLNKAGLQTRPRHFRVGAEASNVSKDPLSQWIALNLKPASSLDYRLVSAAQSTLKDVFGKDARTSVIIPREALKLKTIFDPINAKLSKLLEPKTTEDEVPSVSLPQDCVFRTHLDGDFWNALEKRLDAIGFAVPTRLAELRKNLGESGLASKAKDKRA